MPEDQEKYEVKKRGNAPGREPRESDLKNLEKAQGLQTGPISEEGKAIVSLNAVKSGIHMKMYQNIGKAAGKLPVCDNCGDEQIKICQEAKNCELQVYFVGQYEIARTKRSVDPLEEMNSVSLGSMRMIFESQLNYAIKNMHETKIDDKGREYFLIGNGYIAQLMSMAQLLNVSPEDMLLTRKSQDTSERDFDDEVKEETSREEAKAYLLSLKQSNKEILEAVKKADKDRNQDKDIKEYKAETGEDEDTDKNINLDDIGDSPFEQHARPDSE